MIPIGKHYERCQKRKRALIPWFSIEVGHNDFDNYIIPNLYKLEKNSLKIALKGFLITFAKTFNLPR